MNRQDFEGLALDRVGDFDIDDYPELEIRRAKGNHHCPECGDALIDGYCDNPECSLAVAEEHEYHDDPSLHPECPMCNS